MTMVETKNLVEVTIEQPDDFLKIKETLTRIGIASKKDKILFQSCHILHKRGHYFLTHFKELFALDGKPTDLSDNDLSRRNAIAILLEDWGLLKIVNEDSVMSPPPIVVSQIKILSHKEKNDWELVAKYQIGKKSA